jgi:hypothetical protein
MFAHEDTAEGLTAEVAIDDIGPATLKTVVDFLYTDKVEENAINLDLLVAADKYNLAGLFYKCDQM